jgi:hypothetical protein
MPIFSLFSIPLFIILFSAFPWLYIFWVGVGPICRLFFYQFTGVGQSANTLCTVTYTHFVHIIGLPPSTHFAVHKWAHFGCNSRPMTGRKNKKKLKKLKRKRRRKKKNESCCLSLSPMTKRNESARSPSTLSDDLGCVGLNKHTPEWAGKTYGQRNDEGLSPRLVGRSLIYLVYWSVFFSPTPRHGQSTGG